MRALQREFYSSSKLRVIGALRACALSGLWGPAAPLGPVAAPLASSLRAPSRPHPPHDGPSAADALQGVLQPTVRQVRATREDDSRDRSETDRSEPRSECG